MTLNPYLDIAPEVQHALQNGVPVVALESTIISHGMPYPQNVQTALMVEAEVRAHGAVPATIAIVNGRLKAGLSEADIEQLGRSGRDVVKVSRRDVPFIVAAGATGATTVASTMIIAAIERTCTMMISNVMAIMIGSKGKIALPALPDSSMAPACSIR